LLLPVAPVLKESKTVSLWKSMSSSSPDAKHLASLSDPISVDARSDGATEKRCGRFITRMGTGGDDGGAEVTYELVDGESE
jgi:hypothetical protein